MRYFYVHSLPFELYWRCGRTRISKLAEMAGRPTVHNNNIRTDNRRQNANASQNKKRSNATHKPNLSCFTFYFAESNLRDNFTQKGNNLLNNVVLVDKTTIFA